MAARSTRAGNIYSLVEGQATIRDRFRARHNRTGALPLFPGIQQACEAPEGRDCSITGLTARLAVESIIR